MNIVTFSNNNKSSDNIPLHSNDAQTSQFKNSINRNTINTFTQPNSSPRNYDSSSYFSTFQGDINMSNNSTVSDQANQQPPKSAAPLDTRGRQDSISYFTNFGNNNNGPRFSTDSSSSISNFLSLPIPGDQNVSNYDSNGRGLSIINNLFNAPVSQVPGSTAGQQVGPQAQPSSGQNYLPSNDYNSYSQIRRPSEQLEPFNPSIKLKAPSFSSKKGSNSFIPGGSFSEASSEFDIFSKRDSIRQGRQPSFLNNGSLNDSSDFDFFAKRDSIKNSEDFEFKDPNFGIDNRKKTKSEPDTTDPRQPSLHQHSTPLVSSHLANDQQSSESYFNSQPFRQPALPYNDFQQQSSKTGPPLRVPRNPFAQYQYPKPVEQLSTHQQLQSFQLPGATEGAGISPTFEVVGKTRRNAAAVQKPNKKARKVKSSSNASNVSSESLNSELVVANRDSPQQLSPEYNASSQHSRTVTPHDSNGQRPLLGATKVDQLMLVIQARKKGVHKQIPISEDGEILDDGLLPDETELVGGIDKPKNKSSKNHECEYCHKKFTQSTHLEVHVRSHIGLKPFQCTYCGKKFTQGGNLRTHLRLHTGEKPYACEICGKSFSRKGNLAAHKLTHDNLKPFECKLDDCQKSFTQLGNLKAHQNRFHLETLNKLTERLAEVDPNDASMKNEERELLNYLATLYKNSNRGIKGRGKRAEAAEQTSPSASEALQQHEPGQQLDQPGLTYPQRPRSMEYRPYTLPGAKSENISFKNVNYQG